MQPTRCSRQHLRPPLHDPEKGVSSMDVQTGLTTLLVVSLVAALAPFVSALLARIRLPQVVVFIVGGVLIGPEVLGWADPAAIALLANVGLGFLFLLAG